MLLERLRPSVFETHDELYNFQNDLVDVLIDNID
jgi:hypothetical protein